MPLFQIHDNEVQQINISYFASERELHELFEKNLDKLLDIRLLASEYLINTDGHEGKIDTLGIDRDNTPIIIEYKLETSRDVLTQGLFYYRWLNNNRRHFNLLVETAHDEINIRWPPRLMIIAQKFDRYTRGAAQIKQLDFVDLIRYSVHENGILLLEREAGSHTWQLANTSPEDISENDIRRTEYNLEYHVNQTLKELHQPFQNLRDFILNLGEIEERAEQKTGISYWTTKALVRFEFRRKFIDVLLQEQAINDDPDNRLKDIRSYQWGYPYQFRIEKPKDIMYAQRLIEVIYQAIQ